MKRADPAATPNWLEAWRLRQKMSKRAAAKTLGLSFNTIVAYEADAARIPRHVALACAAISYGLAPMSLEEKKDAAHHF